MVYNIKTTLFGSGVMEVDVYGQELERDRERVSKPDFDGEEFIPEFCWTENPYTGKRVLRRDIPLYESVEDIAEKEEHSLESSYHRTRRALYGYSRQCVWEWFITLTFAPDQVDRYDFSACMTKARNWFNNQKKRKAPELKYVAVPEQHKDGAWHVHGVLCDADGMEFTDSGRHNGDYIIYNLTGWKFGFSTATAVVDTSKVSSYIVKYITKDLCAVTAGKQRYYVSKSIPKPEIRYDLVDSEKIEDHVQMLADFQGVELDYRRTVSGYLDVDYRYYKVKQAEEGR